MIYNSATFANEVEILANDHFVAKTMTINFASVETTENGVKVMKAGTPIGANGAANTSTPVGILWKNCYETSPNAAVIVHGFINKSKADAASGLTLVAATIEAAVPMIKFI